MAAPDSTVFGHDPTTGIVSVYADYSGQAWVWQRVGDEVWLERPRFRPWVFARDLQDASALELSDDPAAPFAVQTLTGEEGSLRYLLTARDGQALRRSLLQGASRRLGREVKSFHDLSGYYTTTPIEQYLMASGRTYFKGMNFDDPVRLQFDLETTSLTPETGRIFMVAISDNRGFECVLEAPRPDDEAALIRELLDVIAGRDPDIIENHNISAFDLPYLLGRAAAHRLPLNLGRSGGPRGLWRVQDGRTSPHWACAGREILDTIDAVRRMDLPSAGLKAVSQLFGIAPAGRVYLEGSQIAETYRTDPELVRRYALQDVQEVSALARRVLAASFALAKLAPRPYHRLPYAGSATGMLEPMMVRAYLQAGHALPAEAPRRTGRHSGGAVHLYAEGVLPRVVKADIASMYPSLIRAERIGPACDPLGVFLHLMDHLTALRLHHKAAARRGEAGEHDAMQRAMKIVVNSGYGYLGAGKLALFEDQHAADQITARGREVLGQVVQGLQERGVTLIEADTDGVYFSCPAGWRPEQELAVIAAVGEGLPAGVTLEFDGRAEAMLSHEIKNYALLRYGGGLELTGAAFDSVRSEAYGRDFLQKALTCLLSGDLAGVREAYVQTYAALAQRRLSNAQVASRIRLTKSPEQYAASRASRKESPYESLHLAGVSWQTGRRASFYQQAGRGWVQLSENPDGHDYDIAAYQQNLLATYASRLRKGLRPQDFEQLFRPPSEQGLFDTPFGEMRAVWRAT